MEMSTATKIIVMTPEDRSLFGVKTNGEGNQPFVLRDPQEVLEMLLVAEAANQDSGSVKGTTGQAKVIVIESARAAWELQVSYFYPRALRWQ